MTHSAQIPQRKLNIIFLVFIGLTLLLLSRLLYLQIHLSETFYKKSRKNFLRIEKIAPTRGNILDAQGKLIATNRPIHDIFWQGTGNTRLSAEKLKTLKSLEKIIDKNITEDKTIIEKIKHAEKHNKKFLLASEITFEQLSKIEEKFSNQNTITISTSFKRFYPYQFCSSHILGYLGRIVSETQGKMGLEKMLEETLKGKSGSILTTINSLGKRLSEQTIESALPGKDIQITLHLELQKIVEKIFPQDATGTCILMDPSDGSILALVSRPNFDPNIFLSPISKKEWENLQENHPFLNRAFSACYPPGSIFKLVTISAALEKNIITPDTTCDCKGYIRFGRRKYLCHKHDGHGVLTVSQTLEQSCNILFYDIAQKIDIDTLADYAYRFGLGQKTNVIFPEKSGIIPSKKWKLEHKGERWWKGETLSASIGQSFLAVTPIQVASMISSIFTGYIVKPRVLTQEPIVKKDLEISSETLEFLKQSMQKVVTQGTGKNLSKIKDFEIYAKTSTAQTSALHKRKLGEIYREHRWFVAHLSYKNNKPLTFVILIEHAQNASSAKNAAKRFLITYKNFIDKKNSNVAS